MSACTLRPLTPQDAHTLLGWRYPPPLDFYNPESDPATVEADVAYLLSPAFHYHAWVDDQGRMAGFCCFGEDAQVPGGEYAGPGVDLGLGLAPERLGQGAGDALLAAALALGRQLFQTERFRATVADFNQRSFGLFQRAGFVPTQRFQPPERPDLTFIVLEWAA